MPSKRFELPSLSLDEARAPIKLPSMGLLPKRQLHVEQDTNPAATAEPDLKEYKSSFQKRAKEEKGRFELATDSEYWVCICFETREQKEEFLSRLKLLELGDKHIDGLEAADILGIPIKSPRANWGRGKQNKGLVDLTEDE